MKKRLKKQYNKLLGLFCELGNWVTKNWLVYNYIRTGCLFVIPFVFIVAFPLGAIPLVLLPLFLLLDTRQSIAVKTRPEAHIKSEKIEYLFEVLFLVCAIFFYVYSILIWALRVAGLEEWIPYMTHPYVGVVIVVLVPGILFTAVFNFFRKFVFGIMGLLRNRLPRSLKFLDCYVADDVRATVRLGVVVDALAEDQEIKVRMKKTPFFKEGLSKYSSHVRTWYDFTVKESGKFYRYLRLTALSNDAMNIWKARADLSLIIRLIEAQRHPFEIVKTLKAMIGEPVTKPDDIYDEIEIEPAGDVRKWIHRNSDLLKFLITILVTAISSIIAPMLLR